MSICAHEPLVRTTMRHCSNDGHIPDATASLGGRGYTHLDSASAVPRYIYPLLSLKMTQYCGFNFPLLLG